MKYIFACNTSTFKTIVRKFKNVRKHIYRLFSFFAVKKM